ncbi:hypothetical protein [Flavobacterium sp.]|uniref:hypothetical protein n=1 Tax=Flavobacterium sp. TaxID=239 RepID=UPI0028BD889B|nr:hypothetical protein [Flavobacterium sp.]
MLNDKKKYINLLKNFNKGMKTKKILASLFALMVVVACKDNKETEAAETKVAEQPKETFKVAFDLIIKKDDSLQLYFKDETMKDWVFDKCVTTVVKGSDNVQKVEFALPEDMMPTELRFDFGSNKEQEEIQIKNFKMQYFQKSFEAKDTLFYQYFIPNEYIDYNRNQAIAKPKVVNGNYDPFAFSREVLTTQIQNIIK